MTGSMPPEVRDTPERGDRDAQPPFSRTFYIIVSHTCLNAENAVCICMGASSISTNCHGLALSGQPHPSHVTHGL